MECTFCKKTYSSTSSLLYHQRSTKSCIKIQNEQGVSTQKIITCSFCKKQLTTKCNLDSHLLICKIKIKEDSKVEALKDIENINETFKKLKKEIDKNKAELHLKDKEIKKLKEKLNLKFKTEQPNIKMSPEPNMYKAEIQDYTFDDIIVPIRNDGMINATALCRAGKKLIGHYLENKQTKAYLEAVESNIGIPILELIKVNTGGDHSGTWVHRKIGYHLAQWISPKFAVKVSSILDELFVTGSVILGKEKSSNDIEIAYQCKVNDLQHQLEQKNSEYSELLVKHNSTLKNHRYVKFNEHGSCFYIIESGILCDCKHNINRYKFGIAGTEHDTLDVRLRSHRTIWPQLKVIFIVFLKEVDILEQSIKRIYMNEINPNGHEIIEGVTSEQLIESIKQFISALGLVQYKIMPDERIKEYNDYVTTTVKIN